MDSKKDSGKQYIDDFFEDKPTVTHREPVKKVQRTRPKAPEGQDDEEVVGPSIKKIPKLNAEDIFKENLPSADFYEKSYNHKDIITGIVASSITDQIVTMSADGHIKFWKKVFHLIEFQRHFRAHLGAITGYSLNENHQKLATVSGTDKFLKIFDTMNYDMINMTKLNFTPSVCEFLEQGEAKVSMIAVANSQSGEIELVPEEKETRYIDIQGEDSVEDVRTNTSVNIHKSPVRHIIYNRKYGIVISTDEKGLIEYWDPETGDFPKNSNLKFRMKLETDLFDLAKHKTSALCLCLSHNGEHFAVIGKDKIVRVYKFTTGKIIARYDETARHCIEVQNSDKPEYAKFKLDRIEFDRKMAIEKEIEKSTDFMVTTSIEFDESDTFIIYPSLFGIKVINFHTGELARLIGQHETTERFLKCILYQGKPMKNPTGTSGGGGASSQKKDADPTLYCTAFRKARFFIFSKREPLDTEEKNVQMGGRDVFLEKPTKDDKQVIQAQSSAALGSEAVIETTKGDIVVKLYPDLVPKTIENFVVHSKNGYYNNCIFHRVIKGFMVQTGDPEGNGTGGESIWGEEFEDEFHRTLRHDRPFTVSMANAGPNTNGSQFFITTVPCPWLDNKHTVFGKVTKGMEVVQAIEKAEVGEHDKPLVNIKIITIRIT